MSSETDKRKQSDTSATCVSKSAVERLVSRADRWKEMRTAFERLATRKGWPLDEHPLHAIYLEAGTQRSWEIFKAGFKAAC